MLTSSVRKSEWRTCWNFPIGESRHLYISTGPGEIGLQADFRNRKTSSYLGRRIASFSIVEDSLPKKVTELLASFVHALSARTQILPITKAIHVIPNERLFIHNRRTPGSSHIRFR